MSKLSKDILQKIKEGKGVDTAFIAGHIDTPKMPAGVMDVTEIKGYEFKKTINAERFIEWIESVAAANADENQEMTMKSIEGSEFVYSCQSAKKSIEKSIKNIEGKRYSGFTWHYQTQTTKSVSLEDEMIERAMNAFDNVLSTMIHPIESRSKKYPTLVDESVLENNREIAEYISGRN